MPTSLVSTIFFELLVGLAVATCSSSLRCKRV